MSSQTAMLFDTKYLQFRDHSALYPQKKTRSIQIQSKSSGTILGYILWYGPWRQYCFFPSIETIFNRDCLSDINKAIQELMDERK